MLKVRIKKLRNNSKLPVLGSQHAACYDVYASEIELNSPTQITYKLGFSTEIPVGYKGVIVPRSNLSKTNWYMGNSIGIIDADYRGEWMIKLNCKSNYEHPPYNVGERICQIYFEKVLDVEFEETEELSQTERGEGGFGSTGKH
jgi:dUTP pyrophosphatase